MSESKWISVEDRLPDDGEYIVHYASGDIVVAAFSQDQMKAHNNINYGWICGEEGITYEDEVTHWMPLPEPPTDSSDQRQS